MGKIPHRGIPSVYIHRVVISHSPRRKHGRALLFAKPGSHGGSLCQSLFNKRWIWQAPSLPLRRFSLCVQTNHRLKTYCTSSLLLEQLSQWTGWYSTHRVRSHRETRLRKESFCSNGSIRETRFSQGSALRHCAEKFCFLV